MKNKRVITGIVFAVVVAAFIIPATALPGLTAGFLTLVALICTLEYVNALKRKFLRLSFGMTLTGTLMMLAPLVSWLSYRDLRPGWILIRRNSNAIDEYWRTDMVWLVFIGLGAFALIAMIYALSVMIYQALRNGPKSLPTAFISLSVIPYIAFPFACSLLFLFAIPNGFRWLILAFIAPTITDVAAYYTGIYFGKRRFLGEISPNKTLEGTIGGVVGCVVFCLLFFTIFLRGADPLRNDVAGFLLYGLLAGVLLGFMTQLGDWLASSIKRFAGRKDFSRLLPGHGGLLDRFDSIIFSFPMTLVVAILYSLF
ncbi:MAG TPA: phosphatidate cytidylyltransferase [Clostridiaceae bacterium]|nr:phosphatidate cytidylyltransferase [Clostridiaceae bacterium]